MKEIEVVPFPKEGYQPVVDYESWRVAILKFCDDLKIENIRTMQKHLLTDEVFVLLQGECSLFAGGDGEHVGELSKIDMKPHQVYVVKKGVWHNHIMSEDGEVLIVENRDTSDDNSPIESLNDHQIANLRRL